MRTAYSLLFFLVLSIFSAVAENNNEIEDGKASYYAVKFHNRKTASGIKYQKDKMVCAHRTLKFGTKLLVKNPVNNKEVIVEVIDRGPFKKGRVIDLSYAAAKELGIIRSGVAYVDIEEYREDNRDEKAESISQNEKEANIVLDEQLVEQSSKE